LAYGVSHLCSVLMTLYGKASNFSFKADGFAAA
jgi:hypothetical protein